VEVKILISLLPTEIGKINSNIKHTLNARYSASVKNSIQLIDTEADNNNRYAC
jgi:hypothetical protein